MKLEKTYSLEKLLSTDNIAEILSENDLKVIGQTVVKEFEIDEGSRSGWKSRYEKSTKLALQVAERKNTPWEGASNVKFPLLTIAALQFQSRAYPALVTKPELVKCQEIGDDPTGEKTAHADRVSYFMSWQLLEADENWEADTDRLLIMLPIVGCLFRKTYFDRITGKNKSELILPDHFVASYYTKTLTSCPRYTVILDLNNRDIRNKIVQKEYLKVELTDPQPKESSLDKSNADRGLEKPIDDPDADNPVLEQYRYLDLDGDEYEEPYIVTVLKKSSEVLRVVPQFDPSEIKRDTDPQMQALAQQIQKIASQPLPQDPQAAQAEQVMRVQEIQAYKVQIEKLKKQGQIIYIPRIEYCTKYPFIPSPDGGFYDIGYGQLLQPINDTIDTTINQLIDSGTLQNSNVGFIASNARIRGRDYKFNPFEWKRMDVPAGMLKDGILPLPVNQPSAVLFQLLELLINYGERISSITDIMSGEVPGQNTKTGVAMQALDQGMKVYSGILQRLYRAFTEEYRKLYKLNRIYLNPTQYFTVLGTQQPQQVYQTDFQGSPLEVAPEADPNLGSDSQRIQQAMFLAQRSTQVQGYNPTAVEQRVLKAMKVADIQEIYPPVPPQPNPELVLKQAEQQRKTVESQTKQHIAAMETQARIKALEVQMFTDLAELKQKGDELAVKKVESLISGFEAIHNALAVMEQNQIAQQQQEQEGQENQNGGGGQAQTQ